jgi:hypothetical protein
MEIVPKGSSVNLCICVRSNKITAFRMAKIVAVAGGCTATSTSTVRKGLRGDGIGSGVDVFFVIVTISGVAV